MTTPSTGGNRDVLNTVLKDIAKRFGDRAVIKASDIPPPPRVPTGVFGLDVLLGGGFPLGRLVGLIGQPSGGKSSLAQFTTANAQLIDRNTYKQLIRTDDGDLIDPETGEFGDPLQVVWIDTEQSFDEEWAAACGIDTKELFVLNAPDQESAYDMIVGLIRSTEVDIIVLDSIAAMSPSKEVERSAMDELVGTSARVNNKGLRKITAEMSRVVSAGVRKTAPMVIMINQLREKVGVMFGSNEVLPGGRGQEFFNSLSIRVWPEALGKGLTDEDGEVVARTSTYKIEKNKINGNHGSGKFTIFLRDYETFKRGDTDTVAQVMEWADKLGVIERKGAWITMPDGERVHGIDKAAQHIVDNPETFAEIKRLTLAAAKEAYK